MAIDTLTGGLFQDASGNALAGGLIVFRLSSPAQTISDGQAVQNALVNFKLNSSGSVPNGSQLYGNDQLTPRGTYYTVYIYSSTGQLVRGPESWVLLGASPIDLGGLTSVMSTLSYSSPIVSNPSGPQSIANFALQVPTLNLTGKVGLYNNTATAGGGVPAELYQTLASGLVANFNGGTAANLFVPSANGQWRISYSQAITQAGNTSGTMPNLTLGWTDAANIARSKVVIATNSSNLTNYEVDGVTVIFTNATTPATIASAGYASAGASNLKYDLSVTAEQL